MFNYFDGNLALDSLQNDLILIEKFARDWQLIISIAKTYIMHIMDLKIIILSVFLMVLKCNVRKLQMI